MMESVSICEIHWVHSPYPHLAVLHHDATGLSELVSDAQRLDAIPDQPLDPGAVIAQAAYLRLARHLHAAGWEYIGVGLHWYAAQYQRSTPAPHYTQASRTE